MIVQQSDAVENEMRASLWIVRASKKSYCITLFIFGFFMCILVALDVIVVVATVVAVAEFSCMRRLWIHKATAKGKNITIFQFSFALYLDKMMMKKKCVYCADFEWIDVAFLSKRVRESFNFVASDFPIKFSSFQFALHFGFEKNLNSLYLNQSYSKWIFLFFLLVCAIQHLGN